jgi:outer membrane protein assembly factor BamE (lipoprotein component of BamABCDE complex)
MRRTPLQAIIRRSLPLRWSALLVAAALALGGCHGRRLTRANVAEVSEGMTRKQVESILGPPTSIDSTDLLILKRVTYTYQQANESVVIVFTNDKVTSKESNLRE